MRADHLPNLALNVARFVGVTAAVRRKFLPARLDEAVDSFAVGDQKLFPVAGPDIERH